MASSFNAGWAEVTTACPTPVELLNTALGLNSDMRRAVIARHAATCEACRERIHDIREVAAELHTVPIASVSINCLSDDAIAALADGDSAADEYAVSHAASCAKCRTRVAAIARLMNDGIVSSEINALEASRRSRLPQWSRRQFTLSGGLLAAAAAAIVLLGPVRSRINPDTPPYRESALTAASAPRIVATEITRLADSLRWTSVSEADLYRVRIWNSEGTVVWSTDTRDTTVMLPRIIRAGTQYMWDVSARTEWDRWVSSDLVELKIAAQQAP